MQPEFTNSVLVSHGRDCIIFDAWGRAEDWRRVLESRNLQLRAIYATHGHGDHISATPELARMYNVPWYMNLRDLPLVLWSNQILDYWGLPRISDDFVQPQDLCADKTKILGDTDMEIIPAPGHSAGGVMFYFPEHKILLSGDTIFHDGVGRTDLPGGNADELRETIADLVARNLPNDTHIIHGHGDDSMWGELRQNNSCIRF